MRVIIGIGNYGKQYDGTRHNVGFEVVDRLAALSGSSTWTRKWNSEVMEWRNGNDRVVLVKPRTYVNGSGAAAQAVLSFYKVPPTELLVIVDDINLPVGTLRSRPDGSAGGHNGLRDIEARLGKVYPRLRLGVGAPPGSGTDQIAHVLGGFHPDERTDAQDMIAKAAQAAQAWLSGGMDPLMTFNGPLRPPPPKPKVPRPVAQKPADTASNVDAPADISSTQPSPPPEENP